jgi:hypothetical protein
VYRDTNSTSLAKAEPHSDLSRGSHRGEVSPTRRAQTSAGWLRILSALELTRTRNCFFATFFDDSTWGDSFCMRALPRHSRSPGTLVLSSRARSLDPLSLHTGDVRCSFVLFSAESRSVWERISAMPCRRDDLRVHRPSGKAVRASLAAMTSKADALTDTETGLLRDRVTPAVADTSAGRAGAASPLAGGDSRPGRVCPASGCRQRQPCASQ